MTIQEAIEAANRLEIVSYPTETLVGWLSDLDHQLFNEVIYEHDPFKYVRKTNIWWENALDMHPMPIPEFKIPEANFVPYNPDTSLNQELLVEDGYANDVYSNYLAARINQMNGDIERYTNSAALYNNAVNAWKTHYTKTHMPAHHGRIRF